MRVTAFALGIFALLQSPGLAQPQEVQNAIRSALSWHFRWIEGIPHNLASIECSVALFEKRSFAYCGPIALSMNIETDGKTEPRVSYMGRELSSYDSAVAAFRRNVNPNGQSLGPVHRLSIAVHSLGGCTIDWKRTESAPSLTLTREVRTALLISGDTLRFPVICRGDPFYLLYCLTGERVSWIWLYETIGPRFELRWSFDSDTQQRIPPVRAIENLNKKDLWYKVEGGRN